MAYDQPTMSNFDFTQRPHAATMQAEQIAAQRAAFHALSPQEQAAALAKFEATRAAVIALRTRMAQFQAQRAIAKAQK